MSKGRQRFERQAVDGGQLTGDAVMAPKVRPVGDGLVIDLEDEIVMPQELCQGLAGNAIEALEVDDDRVVIRGEELLQVQLAGSTDHPLAGFAAQFGGLDLHRLALAMPADEGARDGNRDPLAIHQVGAPTNDTGGGLGADIHFDYAQLVCVRMRQHLQHPPHQHLIQASGEVMHAFHLYGGHREVVSQLLHAEICRQVKVFFDPIK